MKKNLFQVLVSSVGLIECLLQAVYMFHALAIVCDVYFVPSLEKVSEVWTTDTSHDSTVSSLYIPWVVPSYIFICCIFNHRISGVTLYLTYNIFWKVRNKALVQNARPYHLCLQIRIFKPEFEHIWFHLLFFFNFFFFYFTTDHMTFTHS